jgi:hypothetical protein
VSDARSIDPDSLVPHLRVVRLGHGANCSSVGSVIDTLFVSAVVGGAVFTAIAAALAREEVRTVGSPPEADATRERERDGRDEDAR